MIIVPIVKMKKVTLRLNGLIKGTQFMNGGTQIGIRADLTPELAFVFLLFVAYYVYGVLKLHALVTSPNILCFKYLRN